MLGAAGHLAEVVALRAHLNRLVGPGSSVACKRDGATRLWIKALLVVDEFLQFLQLRDLLLHLLLALRGLELHYLLMELADRLEASIAKLTVDVRAARQYFQLVAQEQVVILSCGYLVEDPTSLGGLRDLDCVDGGEDLGSTLRSWRWRRHLPTKLSSHGQAERCAKYAVFLLHPYSKISLYSISNIFLYYLY